MAFLDETGLAELWSLIKAEDAKAPKVVYGSYVGTGTCGQSNPSSLTFDFEPKVLVFLSSSFMGQMVAYRNGATFMSSCSFWSDGGYDAQYCTFVWSGNTVTWYNKNDASYQKNGSGATYYYLAIG